MQQSVFIDQDGELVEVTLHPEHFSIDESAIDATLCQMGKLILDYGTVEAEVKLRVGKLSADLEHVRAILDKEIRDQLKASDERATEARVQGEIARHETYITYVQALNQAERDAAMMRWVMEALRHKSECLRAYAYRENQSMKMDNKYS